MNGIVDSIAEKFYGGIPDDQTCFEIERFIRKMYPGEYTIKCTLTGPNNNIPNIDLIFADPEDEVIFKLKYQL